jgi:hypothetical protein
LILNPHRNGKYFEIYNIGPWTSESARITRREGEANLKLLMQATRVAGLGEFSPLGRIFPSWANVYFGHLTVNCRSRPNDWATFFHWKKIFILFVEKSIGPQFGRFSYKLIWSPCWQPSLAKQTDEKGENCFLNFLANLTTGFERRTTNNKGV